VRKGFRIFGLDDVAFNGLYTFIWLQDMMRNPTLRFLRTSMDPEYVGTSAENALDTVSNKKYLNVDAVSK
jgi:hypothetical protein